VFPKYLAIFIIIICTVLLQAHSIPFWIEQTNTSMGYLWSLSLEGVALWLWLNKKHILATVVSTIIVLVPLMQLSKPLLREMRLVNANVHISKLNSLEVTQSKLLQDKYIKTDWAGILSKNTQKFRDAISTQRKLLFSSLKLKSIYENIIIIVLQSVALMVVLLTQIQALKMLAFRDFEIYETPEISKTTSFEKVEKLETSETRAETLLMKIDIYKENISVTQSEIAKKLDVPASDISKLRSIVKGTGEGLSSNKFKELEEKFEKLTS